LIDRFISTVQTAKNSSLSAYNGVSGHPYRFSSDSLRRDIRDVA